MASIGNQETIKKSVQNGIAISIISRLAAEEETNSGKLLSFPIPSKDGGRDLNVVYNRNFHLTHSAGSIYQDCKRDLCKEKIGNEKEMHFIDFIYKVHFFIVLFY